MHLGRTFLLFSLGLIFSAAALASPYRLSFSGHLYTDNNDYAGDFEGYLIFDLANSEQAVGDGVNQYGFLTLAGCSNPTQCYGNETPLVSDWHVTSTFGEVSQRKLGYSSGVVDRSRIVDPGRPELTQWAAFADNNEVEPIPNAYRYNIIEIAFAGSGMYSDVQDVTGPIDLSGAYYNSFFVEDSVIADCRASCIREGIRWRGRIEALAISAVPEPGSMVLTLSALLVVVGLSRRALRISAAHPADSRRGTSADRRLV